jgi:hypothetical protein
VICFGCKHMGMRVLTAKIRMIKGEIHRP